MSTYGSGVYGSGTYSLGESIAISRIRIFKSINDKVTNFQVLADKERILLYWDPISRSIPFKALAVDGNDIHLSTIVDVGDSTYPYDTFTVAASAGVSSIDDIYNNSNIIFFTGMNFGSPPKKIKDYAGSSRTFTTDKLEFPIATGDRFGLVESMGLIDDSLMYVGSTITYTDSEHTLTNYDSSTKTFTVSGGLTLLPGENFVLTNAYYPKLYISKNKGETFDVSAHLTYMVSALPTGTLLESNYYYNSFRDENSTLLNITDPVFYIGSVITFITGVNKGLSRTVRNFDMNTREFTTDYFPNIIEIGDVFSVNTFSLPLVSDIENYLFKMILTNGI